MAHNPIRHRLQDRSRPHALAVAQLHGLLPSRRHLPFTPRRDVLGRFHGPGIQLALLTRVHRARDDCHGLDGEGDGSAGVLFKSE